MANNTSRLQQYLESIWYHQDKGRCLLIPLSYLYSAINSFQRKIQTKNQKQLPCPVIVVGNITVGGTGKTPLTIHIVQLLKKANYKPAIITRGYGGKAKTWPQSVTANSDASLMGDEAVLMSQRTNVPVYAGANRLESIEQLLKENDCDVIISDDGMQHYKLPRDIQIAVIDGKRQLGNGYCLPAGPLREKKERLNDCDLIVINGKNSEDLDYHEMSLTGDVLVNLSTQEEKALSYFQGQEVQALTGIGNPQRFYSALKTAGLKLNENSYADHYAFTKSDLDFSHDQIVIMTEKDAVKCKSLIGTSKNFWMLPVQAQLSENFDRQLLGQLKTIKEV